MIETDATQTTIMGYARDVGIFAAQAVIDAHTLDKHAAHRALRALVHSGELILHRHVKRRVYKIADLAAFSAASKEALATPEGCIWTAMRMHRSFSTVDLWASLEPLPKAPTKKGMEDYCTRLANAGVLRLVKKPRGAQAAHYTLVVNSGRLPPVIVSVPLLFDQNTQEYLDDGKLRT